MRYLAWLDRELDLPKGWGLVFVLVTVPVVAYVVSSAVLFLWCLGTCSVYI